jgi:hypothetical protein
MIRRLVEGLRYVPDSDGEPEFSLLEVEVNRMLRKLESK